MPLTKDRDTPRIDGVERVVGVAAATIIYKGALVALSAAGLATPGAVATTLTALGRAEETVDNSAGAAGAKTVRVRRGVFRFKNHGADAVVAADIGKDCWIVDDETVAKTNGTNTRSKAGRVHDVESTGVWVEIL